MAWFRDYLGGARSAAAALARRCGFDDHRGGQVALAVAEVVSNLNKYAKDGALALRVVRTVEAAGVEFAAVDSGPGMTDLVRSLHDGESTSGTPGTGLGAIRHLADACDIHSSPGSGTVVVARFWPRPGHRTPTSATRPAVTGLTRAISGETICGDAWAARKLAPEDSGGDHAPVLVMLCDGLGHGPLAANASAVAAGVFRTTAVQRPQEIMELLHAELRGTRGAAVAVALVEPAHRRLLFCGVGNISARLIFPGGQTVLVSKPGIVGYQMSRSRAHEFSLPAGGVLVLHSDGLTERWQAADIPRLANHEPLTGAARLLRLAGTRGDDASVLVANNLW